jgi:hypothetical protein
MWRFSAHRDSFFLTQPIRASAPAAFLKEFAVLRANKTSPAARAPAFKQGKSPDDGLIMVRLI